MRTRTKPLTVLLILEATAGGTARHLLDVAEGLCRRGILVTIACAFRRDPSFREALEKLAPSGVRVFEVDMARGVSPLSDCAACFRIRRLMQTLQPDVTHLHSTKAGALGRIVAPFTRIGSVVYSPHAFAFLGASSQWVRRLELLVERLLGVATDHLVAVSETEADLAVRHRVVHPSRVSVVPNGIDADAFPPRSRPPGVGPPLRIGYLGRLDAQKAPMRLLDLADALRTRALDFQLEIAGAGALLSSCIDACHAKKLADRVRFLGHVAAPKRFYESIDLFVITSTFEGLPYSVLDAMAFELPVVGFDVPGVKDLVSHARTGLLAPPFRVDRMADLICNASSEPHALRSIGVAARKRVLEEFRLADQLDGLVALYERLRDTPRGSNSETGRPHREPS